MGGVPRRAWSSAGQAIVMPQHRRPRTAARPVLAGHFSGSTVGRRAGQDVVPVRRSRWIDHSSLLVERRVSVDVRLVGVEIGNALGHERALDVVPGPGTDSISGVHAAGTGRAEIGPPGSIAHAGRLRKRLAALVGACQAAEIASAGSGTRDEEACDAAAGRTPGPSGRSSEERLRALPRQCCDSWKTPP